MKKRKSNKWYLAKDEPVKDGGFRKGAEIGGRDDLNGLLKDKSITIGTILVRNNIFYVVENGRDNGYKRSRIDTIASFFNDSHISIPIKVKNDITSLTVDGKSYQMKTNELITKLKLLKDLNDE